MVLDLLRLVFDFSHSNFKIGQSLTFLFFLLKSFAFHFKYEKSHYRRTQVKHSRINQNL